MTRQRTPETVSILLESSTELRSEAIAPTTPDSTDSLNLESLPAERDCHDRSVSSHELAARGPGVGSFRDVPVYSREPPAFSKLVPKQMFADAAGQLPVSDTNMKATMLLWEDQGTICFVVEVNGICIARREDNNFVNGTKLLHVAGVSRPRRDDILAREKLREVVKLGPAHIKGVWIPLERALSFANKEKITGMLYPLFVRNIASIFPQKQDRHSNQLSGDNLKTHNVMIAMQSPSQIRQEANSLGRQMRTEEIVSGNAEPGQANEQALRSLTPQQSLKPHDQLTGPNDGHSSDAWHDRAQELSLLWQHANFSTPRASQHSIAAKEATKEGLADMYPPPTFSPLSFITTNYGTGSTGAVVTIQRRLAVKVLSVKTAFKLLLRLSGLKHSNTCTEFREAAERFQLWASNLGLYQTGHASLGYRFQDAPKLEALTMDILDEIHEHLDKVTKYIMNPLGNIAPGETSDTESVYSDDSSLGDLDSIPFDSIIVQSVFEFIDRLYELATRIQDPRLRIGGTKAKTFQHIDPETGIDLFDAYKPFDRGYIEEYILDQRSPVQARSQKNSTNHDISELEQQDVQLIDRLLAANTLRRKQFGHWRKLYTKGRRLMIAGLGNDTLAHENHGQDSNVDSSRNKLPGIVHPQVAVEPTVLSGTTVTKIEDNSMLDIQECHSVATSAVFSSRPHGCDLTLPVPELPIHVQEHKNFECPYCFNLCSQKQAQRRYWMRHVLHDLRPYVCTNMSCTEGDQLFDSYKQWCIHVMSHDLRNFSMKVSPNDFKMTCVICKEAGVPLQHVAAHLKCIALFSLPKPTGYETAEGDDTAREAQPRTLNGEGSELSSISRSSTNGEVYSDCGSKSSDVIGDTSGPRE